MTARPHVGRRDDEIVRDAGQPRRSPPSVIIDDPLLEKLALRVRRAAVLALQKGIAHAVDPSRFPLRDDAVHDELERFAARYLAGRPPRVREAAGARVLALVEERAARSGAWPAVELGSSEPVADQVAAIEVPEGERLPRGHLESLELVDGRIAKRPLRATSRPDEDALDSSLSREERSPSRGQPPPSFGTGLVFNPDLAEAHDNPGPISDKWLAMGGSAGALGSPEAEEVSLPGVAKGRLRRFEGGEIYYSPKTGARAFVHALDSAIVHKWSALGGTTGRLGMPITDGTVAPDGVGRFCHFEDGSVYHHPSSGAHEIHGKIRSKWAQHGYELGRLGYPVGDVEPALHGKGERSRFQGGLIYTHPTLGTRLIRAEIHAWWLDHGGIDGYPGYPVEDTQGGSSTAMQKFQGAWIRWRASSGYTDMATNKDFVYLHLDNIQCVVDTNESGADEIEIGGVLTDPAQHNHKLGPYHLGSFRKGTQKNTWPYPLMMKPVLAKAPTRTPGWPKVLSATVQLAEEDGGGFSADLDDLLGGINDLLVKELDKAGYAAAEAVASALGLGAGLGAVLAKVLAFVVVEVLEWIWDEFMDFFEDDPFPPVVFPLVLDTIHDDLPIVTKFWTKSGGGHYDFRLRWDLSRW